MLLILCQSSPPLLDRRSRGCPQQHPQLLPTHARRLLRLGQAPDARDIQPLVRSVASQRAQMLATLQIPAGFQRAQGHASEAAVLYQRVLAIRENILGADHPLTTDTHERLQAVLVVLGQTEEAARVEVPRKEEKGMAAAKNRMSEV